MNVSCVAIPLSMVRSLGIVRPPVDVGMTSVGATSLGGGGDEVTTGRVSTSAFVSTPLAASIPGMPSRFSLPRVC